MVCAPMYVVMSCALSPPHITHTHWCLLTDIESNAMYKSLLAQHLSTTNMQMGDSHLDQHLLSVILAERKSHKNRNRQTAT